MFVIKEYTRGRFGNKLLQYHALCQLGNRYNAPIAAPINDDIVRVLQPYTKNNNVPNYDVDLGPNELINGFEYDDSLIYNINDCCLHNIFFETINEDPRKFLFPKSRMDEGNKTRIGIHIRGTDFFTVDKGREIYPSSYYINAIKMLHDVSNPDYYLCTDDTSCSMWKDVRDFLVQGNYDIVYGNVANKMTDFHYLCGCHIMISSASTFAMAAALIGQPKMIHWQGMIDRYRNKTHPYPHPEAQSFIDFWYKLEDGGCEWYKPWRIIQ